MNSGIIAALMMSMKNAPAMGTMRSALCEEDRDVEDVVERGAREHARARTLCPVPGQRVSTSLPITAREPMRS